MPRLLMIDNYDSFTYNLVQYLGELGAEVEVRRNDAVTLEEVAALGPDGVVISPGPCTPREAGVSVPLIERFAGRVPILGVCLRHRTLFVEGVQFHPESILTTEGKRLLGNFVARLRGGRPARAA